MTETFEAREKKIGSIRIVKNPNFPSGTHLQAYIKTNRAELRKVFGNPNMGESGDGKSKGKEWNLWVGGKRVTIYDKREKDKKGTKYFNIGGSGKFGALLVAQALSIHRNERVHAKETVPKWLEDKGHHQQVKSIDEHPDLTYQRAKEYWENTGRYGAETFDVEFNEWAEQEMMSHGKDISFKDWAEDEGMKHGDVPITDWAQHEDESHDARYGAEAEGANRYWMKKVKWNIGGKDDDYKSKMIQRFGKDGIFTSTKAAKKDFDEMVKQAVNLTNVVYVNSKQIPYPYDGKTVATAKAKWNDNPPSRYGKKMNSVTAQGVVCWVKYYPMVKLGAESFEDYEMSLEAETSEDDYVDYTMWIYTKSAGGLFNGEWEDGESEEQVVKEWKELVREAIEENGDDLITADLRKHSNYDEEGVSQSHEFLFEYQHGEDNLEDFESENWGGNPKGQLATALRNARIKAKQPKKPLKIEKLDAEMITRTSYACSDCGREYEQRRSADKCCFAGCPHTWELDKTRDWEDGMFTMYVSCRKCGTTSWIEGHADENSDSNPTPTFNAETSGQWEIGEQLEEAQMNAEGKKRSGLLSDPFDELSLDSGDWKGIVAGFGVGLLALFGYSKLRK